MPGTKMQEIIPPEMVPKDMKRPILDDMISHRVEDIRVVPEEAPKTLEDVPQMKINPAGKDIKLAPVAQGKDGEEPSDVFKSQRQEAIDKSLMVRNTVPSVDIEKKMKGLKEY
jgi:hypothetical protein